MYLTIEDEVIGVVEKGTITKVYPKDVTVEELNTDEADCIDSALIGTRPEADTLVQLVDGPTDYKLIWTPFNVTRTLSSDQTFEQVQPASVKRA